MIVDGMGRGICGFDALFVWWLGYWCFVVEPELCIGLSCVLRLGCVFVC